MKRFLFLALLLKAFMCNAQYDWTEGELILKNRDTLNGFVRIPMNVSRLISFANPKVEFKKHIDSRVFAYGKSKVDRIYFNTYDVNPGYYEFAPLGKRKFRLFKKIINGRVKLYKRTVAIEYKTTSIYNPLDVVDVYYEEEDEFYVIRKTESSLTPLISHYSTKGFIEKASKYFSDCKKLVNYIDKGLYSEEDIIELVNDYNLLCN